MSARRRRRSKRRYRRDCRGRFLPAVRRKRKRGRKGGPRGNPRFKALKMTRAEWKAVHRDYKSRIDGVPHVLRLTPRGTMLVPVRIVKSKTSRSRNPLLQIVGYPLSRTGNPWGSVAHGFAMGVGADVAGRAMRKVWGRNPRRRNPPRPGQKILSERVMTVAEARRFPGFMAAAKGYKRFHGSAPSSVSLVRIADGQKQVTRRAVFAMGKAPEMTYKPLPGQKTNKAGATWVHKMGEHGGKPPLLVHDPKSGVTSFVGGTFRVADWVRH